MMKNYQAFGDSDIFFRLNRAVESGVDIANEAIEFGECNTRVAAKEL